MIEYFKARVNVVYLVASAVLIIGLFAYPYYYGIEVSDHISKNTPLMTLGVSILLIPMFIQATRATLRSDLIDQDIIVDVTSSFRKFENYDKDVFKMSIGRLYLETADQRSSAMKNLALGFGLTLIAVILAINLVFVSRTVEPLNFNTEYYLFTYLYPRIGAIIFIQAIASFFLRWYGANIRKVGEISDKILLIEMKKAALLDAGDSVSRQETLSWLAQLSLNSLSNNKKPRSKDYGLALLDKTTINLGNK